MRKFDITKDPYEENGLRITPFGDHPAAHKSHEAKADTYLYLPGSGDDRVGLRLGGETLEGISTSAVVKIGQGVYYRVLTDAELEPVFMELTDPSFADGVPVDREDLNPDVFNLLGEGRVVVYPDSSRYFVTPNGQKRPTGWFTQGHKGELLGVAESQWEQIRNEEGLHSHKRAQEFWMPSIGQLQVQVGTDQIPVQVGEVLRADPADIRAISGIVLDQVAGCVQFGCMQWPSCFAMGRDGDKVSA